MKNVKLLIMFLFLICIILSCEKWSLESTNFLQLEIKDIQSISTTSLIITGEIKGLHVGEISDHGYVWTSNEEFPNTLFNEKKSLGILSKEDSSSFPIILNNLLPKTRYIFAIYAQSNGEIEYSDTLHYTTGGGMGMVTTDSLNYISGTTNLEIYGSFFGSETGIRAIHHGFCWSNNNILPTLEDEKSTLGLLQANQPFTFTFEELLKDISFYFRAYAITQFPGTLDKDTIYGSSLIFDQDLEVWIQKTDFAGSVRINAVGFSIGNKGYVGTGDGQVGKKNDFWEYDPINDQWTQKANFAGGARSGAVGFSIGNKGYVGTGSKEGSPTTNDFWEYDPSVDQWTQKANFAGDARSNALGFSIGNKGYVGIGWKGILTNDFWEYDPSADQWTPKMDFAGDARSGAVGFSIGNKGYVGTGWYENSDFWEYDPILDQWTQKADFAGGKRWAAVGFSIGNKGYVGTGSKEAPATTNDFWEYDSSADQWIQKPDFAGGTRIYAVGFSIGNRGYISTGKINVTDDIFYNDFWEY